MDAVGYSLGAMSRAAPSIWWWAFGYFACYVPYSALTRALSEAQLPGMTREIPGTVLLPSTAVASFVASVLFLVLTGWWHEAGRAQVAGLRVPVPSRWTLLSGLCTAAIIVTTTLAYTFHGTSIVFMMLLMRGGVLSLAPLVDVLNRRAVRWNAWVALALSFVALLVAFSARGGWNLGAAAVVDLAVYVASYFVRMRFMSRLAKSDDGAASRRYFVEEQLVAAPAVLIVLAAVALVGHGEVATHLRAGFVELLPSRWGAVGLLVGVLSQGTGIFGGLILLDRREHTFCVPVNRASSVLAGVVASFGAAWLWGSHTPPAGDLAGAAMMVVALAFLSAPDVIGKLRRPAAAA